MNRPLLVIPSPGGLFSLLEQRHIAHHASAWNGGEPARDSGGPPRGRSAAKTPTGSGRRWGE